jgi:hypothetical protein
MGSQLAQTLSACCLLPVAGNSKARRSKLGDRIQHGEFKLLRAPSAAALQRAPKILYTNRVQTRSAFDLPWTRSCSPKSDYGKLVASQNAKKHRRRQLDVTFVSL